MVTLVIGTAFLLCMVVVLFALVKHIKDKVQF